MASIEFLVGEKTLDGSVWVKMTNFTDKKSSGLFLSMEEITDMGVPTSTKMEFLIESLSGKCDALQNEDYKVLKKFLLEMGKKI